MFFDNPPDENATVDQWKAWMAIEEAKIRKADRRPTIVNGLSMPSVAIRKINGTYRQCPSFGFSGSAEDGSLTREPSVDADQEKAIDLANSLDRPRGTSHRLSGAEKRKARRLRRKMRM